MITQFALVLILVVGAALMTQSVGKLLALNPGFSLQHLSFLDMNLDEQRYPETRQKAEFFHQLLANIRTLPGIESAALVQYRPLLSAKAECFAELEEQPSPDNRSQRVEYHPVSDKYFETLGIPVIRGRPLNAEDMRNSATLAVINQTMARRFWKEENPLGKRLTLDMTNWLTVVGVVGDVRYRLDAPPGLPSMRHFRVINVGQVG
jgi:hypothetical protein